MHHQLKVSFYPLFFSILEQLQILKIQTQDRNLEKEFDSNQNYSGSEMGAELPEFLRGV